MVRAILDGRKTQMRRVTKPQPAENVSTSDRHLWWTCAHDSSKLTSRHPACPYGQPDERLWVRETWAREPETGEVFLRADVGADWIPPDGKWRPSVHMPRALSRITLEVTDVRVERLQDIRFYDIRAEGLDCPEHDGPGLMCTSECSWLACAFVGLWDTINAKRGHSWEQNDWVWVVGFKVLR